MRFSMMISMRIISKSMASVVEQAVVAWFEGKEAAFFYTEALKRLDSKYFNIIAVDNYDVTIMSRNIRHYWYRYNPEYTGEGTVIIFHKHKFSHPYHQHGRTNTLRQREGLRAMISGR